MPDIDRKSFCKALAFTALFIVNSAQIIKVGKGGGIAASDHKALQLAEEMEAFCFGEAEICSTNNNDSLKLKAEDLLKSYIAALRDAGSAPMDFDRATLLRMYELLHIRNLRHDQKVFFETGDTNLIANRVLQLVNEQIEREERL